MIISKKTVLKPLLESNQGVHLTAYLTNKGSLPDITKQLRAVLDQATEFLKPVMDMETRNRFLAPIEALMLDNKVINQMKGNIGIFRNENSFQVLHLPIEVATVCQVATSFYVKPLLKWIQDDKLFLLLDIENDSAHLYLGSQDSFKHVDSITFSEYIETPTLKSKMEEIDFWLDEWVSQLKNRPETSLFITGEKSIIDSLTKKLHRKNILVMPVLKICNQQMSKDIYHSVRKLIKDESRILVDKALIEFNLAQESKLTSKNIFQISKAVTRKQVSKLIIADELNIFGKIDPKSGKLTIHQFDQDHEDDDILDDLAQMVLSQGGEVVVAPSDKMPKGLPVVAILHNLNSAPLYNSA